MRKTKRMRKIIIAVVLGLLAAMAAYAQPAMAATRTTLQLCCTNVYYEGETVARAWGYNQYGQLGDGTYTHRNTPVGVSNLKGIQALAAGEVHSLALMEDGTVWAWGANTSGQLGNEADGHGWSNTPMQVSNLSGVKALAAGSEHSLVLKEDGTVWAWGNNSYGQLGNAAAGYGSSTPVQVSNLSGVKAIAASDEHNLALKEDGTVWAWGKNNYGQLGDGTTTNRTTPVQVRNAPLTKKRSKVSGTLNNLSGVTAIAAGGTHSLALMEDGTVRAWGYNERGQLGNGTTTSSKTPVTVRNLSGVKAISGGWAHSLALKQDGTVWTWGNNYDGQLGDGTTTNRTTPVMVSSLSGVKAIAAAYFHNLALMEDGTVRAWGWNGYEGAGLLGNGTSTDHSVTPVTVSNLSRVQAIAAGGYHTLAKVLVPPSVCCVAYSG